MTARLSRLLAVALLVVAGCGGAGPSPGHTLAGTVTIRFSDHWTYVDWNDPTKGCVGIGDFTDIGPGVDVVVRDQANTVIGSAKTTFQAIDKGDCRLGFTVPSVPDASFYWITVAGRNATTYSKADLASKGWAVALTFGG